MSDEEARDLPTIPEIEAQLYKERYIEDIEEDDENIKITATIESTSTDQIVFPMCPNCNKRVTSDENGFNCEVCGEKIEEPNYLMIISTILEDDTGTITTTFFRTEAEKLIDKTTSEAVEILNATGDETALSGILEDCIGAEITIIADANYNQYEENMRLNVKKLIR